MVSLAYSINTETGVNCLPRSYLTEADRRALLVAVITRGLPGALGPVLLTSDVMPGWAVTYMQKCYKVVLS